MSDYDSPDEDDATHGMLKKALDVELPEDFDPTKLPQTGEEYLQHVMYERSKCKAWVTSDIDREKFKNRQTFKVEVDNNFKETQLALLPSAEWQARKIVEFIEFRDFIQFKTEDVITTISAFDEARFVENVLVKTPNFSEIVKNTQASNIRMLELISKLADQLEPGSGFNTCTGAWIYAILTLLRKPLSPDSCHKLREFGKKCRLIRSKLPEDASEQLYLPLNLFICIVARFYNQLDLSDL